MESQSTQLTFQEFLPSYERRRPEDTVLYKVIADNLETFLAETERDPTKKGLPQYVKNEFYRFLDCGILSRGFLRAKCEGCGHEKLVAFACHGKGFCPSCGGKRMAQTAAFLVDHVFPEVDIRQWVLSFPLPIRYLLRTNARLQSDLLAIMIRTISGFLRKKLNIKKNEGHTGAVTLIQHYGGSVNANTHYHSLALDGVFVQEGSNLQFLRASPPTNDDIKSLVKKIATRTLRYLTRKGYFCPNEELFNWEGDLFAEREPVLASCLSASIRYRIALGERAGQKVRRLGSMAESFYEEAKLEGDGCASIGGFSLHGNISCYPLQRRKLEQICNYVARPPIAQERLTQRANGLLAYRLKKPYRDGTEVLLFSPMELLEKLASLVPLPRINAVRYHGILAPHAKLRSQIVPGTAPEEKKDESTSEVPSNKNKRLGWSQLLARVFQIDIKTCPLCGGELKVIAAITDPPVIEQILQHLGLPTTPPPLSPARAPPQTDFDWIA